MWTNSLIFKIFLRFFAWCALFLITWCGAQKKTPENEEDRSLTQFPLVTDSEIYQDYSFGDLGCQSVNENTTLQSAALTELSYVPKEFAAISEQQRPISAITSQEGLKNSIVKRTTYGEFWDRICKWNLSSHGQDCIAPNGASIGWQLKSKEPPLRVCTDRPQFPRRTYERTAIHSLTAIERAYQYFLKRSNETIDPIQLQVFPVYRSVFTEAKDKKGNIVNKAIFLASNLLYFPKSSASQFDVIAVVPEKKLEVRPERPALWESEFPAAHEFEHNKQKMQVRQFKKLNSSLRWDPDSHSYLSEKESALFSRRSSFIAFSEAFADLTAFYALEENTNSVETLPCFGFNRSPAQPAFYDGTPKIYTQSIQGIFDQNMEPKVGRVQDHPQGASMDSCSQPVFTSGHDIAAIFTYQLNRLFSTIAFQIEPRSSSVRSAIKYQFTLAWSRLALKRLEERQGTTSSQEFLRLMIGTAEESVLNLSKDQYRLTPRFHLWCQYKREGFPTLSPQGAAGCQ